jgi:hypothetical protein
MQQHQREHPERLGLVGHQRGQHAGETNCFPAETVRIRLAVTRVEEQIQHVQDGR